MSTAQVFLVCFSILAAATMISFKLLDLVWAVKELKQAMLLNHAATRSFCHDTFVKSQIKDFDPSVSPIASK